MDWCQPTGVKKLKITVNHFGSKCCSMDPYAGQVHVYRIIKIEECLFRPSISQSFYQSFYLWAPQIMFCLQVTLYCFPFLFHFSSLLLEFSVIFFRSLSSSPLIRIEHPILLYLVVVLSSSYSALPFFSVSFSCFPSRIFWNLLSNCVHWSTHPGSCHSIFKQPI